jgi:hypothetical protein
LWFVLIRPIERNGRGNLVQPGGRHGMDLERFERDGAKHLMEIGGKQGIQDMPQAVIMERGPGSPWLQQVQHAPLFQPSPHFVEGMIPMQDREAQGLDPTPRREHMRRVGWHEIVDHRGDLQRS